VAGSCEYGDDPSGYLEGGEFLDYLSVLLASKKRTVINGVILKHLMMALFDVRRHPFRLLYFPFRVSNFARWKYCVERKVLAFSKRWPFFEALSYM
jgi:hypothetical protein